MILTTRLFSALALCACALFSASDSFAGTIIKLNLGNTGPDLVTRSGLLLTGGDAISGTTGAQNTDIEYTGDLDFLADVNSNTASFTLSSVQFSGTPTVAGNIVIQGFQGGLFRLYDPSNVLLLEGPLTNTTLVGTIGSPGVGGLFTTTLGNVTGGTLQPLIVPGTVSLSMNLAGVQTSGGGPGFTVIGGQLQDFSADASVSISADAVPESASVTLLCIGSFAVSVIGPRRRR